MGLSESVENILAEAPACPRRPPRDERQLWFSALVELIRSHGLGMNFYENGAVWPDYPESFSPYDAEYVQHVFLEASPLPHQRAAQLKRLVERAGNGIQGTAR